MQCANISCNKSLAILPKEQLFQCETCYSNNYCSPNCRQIDWQQYHNKSCSNAKSRLHENLGTSVTLDTSGIIVESAPKKVKNLEDYEVVNQTSKIKSDLGKGAFGQVKLVKDKTEPTKLYAMKIINKKQLGTNLGMEYLRREIKIQKKLNHPHIVKLHNFFEDTENAYLILEYAENGNLFFYLKKKKKLPENEAFIYFFQTCVGIDYLHKKGIIHRDLKPENLLLDKQGNIKVCDFGWSAEDVGKRNTFCGTLDYMAPEMIQHKNHDYKIDIWSLGILLFELTHGYPPFKGKTPNEKFHSILDKDVQFVGTSPECQDLIVSLLRFEPSERPNFSSIFNHVWIRKYEKEFKMSIDKFIYNPTKKKTAEEDVEINKSPIPNVKPSNENRILSTPNDNSKFIISDFNSSHNKDQKYSSPISFVQNINLSELPKSPRDIMTLQPTIHSPLSTEPRPVFLNTNTQPESVLSGRKLSPLSLVQSLSTIQSNLQKSSTSPLSQGQTTPTSNVKGVNKAEELIQDMFKTSSRNASKSPPNSGIFTPTRQFNASNALSNEYLGDINSSTKRRTAQENPLNNKFLDDFESSKRKTTNDIGIVYEDRANKFQASSPFQRDKFNGLQTNSTQSPQIGRTPTSDIKIPSSSFLADIGLTPSYLSSLSPKNMEQPNFQKMNPQIAKKELTEESFDVKDSVQLASVNPIPNNDILEAFNRIPLPKLDIDINYKPIESPKPFTEMSFKPIKSPSPTIIENYQKFETKPLTPTASNTQSSSINAEKLNTDVRPFTDSKSQNNVLEKLAQSPVSQKLNESPRKSDNSVGSFYHSPPKVMESTSAVELINKIELHPQQIFSLPNPLGGVSSSKMPAEYPSESKNKNIVVNNTVIQKQQTDVLEVTRENQKLQDEQLRQELRKKEGNFFVPETKTIESLTSAKEDRRQQSPLSYFRGDLSDLPENTSQYLDSSMPRVSTLFNDDTNPEIDDIIEKLPKTMAEPTIKDSHIQHKSKPRETDPRNMTKASNISYVVHENPQVIQKFSALDPPIVNQNLRNILNPPKESFGPAASQSFAEEISFSPSVRTNEISNNRNDPRKLEQVNLNNISGDRFQSNNENQTKMPPAVAAPTDLKVTTHIGEVYIAPTKNDKREANKMAKFDETDSHYNESENLHSQRNDVRQAAHNQDEENYDSGEQFSFGDNELSEEMQELLKTHSIITKSADNKRWVTGEGKIINMSRSRQEVVENARDNWNEWKEQERSQKLFNSKEIRKKPVQQSQKRTANDATGRAKSQPKGEVFEDQREGLMKAYKNRLNDLYALNTITSPQKEGYEEEFEERLRKEDVDEIEEEAKPKDKRNLSIKHEKENRTMSQKKEGRYGRERDYREDDNGNQFDEDQYRDSVVSEHEDTRFDRNRQKRYEKTEKEEYYDRRVDRNPHSSYKGKQTQISETYQQDQSNPKTEAELNSLQKSYNDLKRKKQELEQYLEEMNEEGASKVSRPSWRTLREIPQQKSDHDQPKSEPGFFKTISLLFGCVDRSEQKSSPQGKLKRKKAR